MSPAINNNIIYNFNNLEKSSNVIIYRNKQSIINTFTILVIIANLLGNLSNYTITNQFITTILFSFSYLIYTIIIGLLLFDIYYLGNFLPSNIPINITYILIWIETLSFFSRIISLSVRLSANIISGHTLLHMISDFTTKIAYYNNNKLFKNNLNFNNDDLSLYNYYQYILVNSDMYTENKSIIKELKGKIAHPNKLIKDQIENRFRLISLQNTEFIKIDGLKLKRQLIESLLYYQDKYSNISYKLSMVIFIWIIFMIPLFFILSIMEFFISLLQAYVFYLLINSYLKESFNTH